MAASGMERLRVKADRVDAGHFCHTDIVVDAGHFIQPAIVPADRLVRVNNFIDKIADPGVPSWIGAGGYN